MSIAPTQPSAERNRTVLLASSAREILTYRRQSQRCSGSQSDTSHCRSPHLSQPIRQGGFRESARLTAMAVARISMSRNTDFGGWQDAKRVTGPAAYPRGAHLVSRGGKVRGDLLVDLMHMAGFIGLAAVHLRLLGVHDFCYLEQSKGPKVIMKQSSCLQVPEFLT